MSKSEQESSVVFSVPDFDDDGISYIDIEVIVEMESSICDTANLAETLQRHVKGERQ